jgi:hypothetical protein
MHSTLKLRESDPHDIFAIEPETVPVAWADKVLADIKRDAGHPPESVASDQPPPAGSGASAGVAAPAVDTTFRPTAADDIHVPDIQVPDIQVPSDLAADRPPTSKWAKSAVMLIFAVCSAAAAAVWQHHGDAAKQMIASWAPTFALSSSPPTENTGGAGQAEPPAVQAAAADPTSPQPAAPAQPPQGVAPAAAAPSPDTAQLVQSMGRDLAAMGQQIEQLKASIAELRAAQQVAARDVAKPAEVRTSVANPRPRMSAPPPRSAAAPARRPMPAYTPAQAAAPAPLPQPMPQASPYPAAPPPAPPPQAAVESDGEPVVRPPMPLR